MRAFKSLAVSVSITLFCAGFAVAGTRLRVTGDDVSLRPRGDLHSEVLGSVSRGQTLEAVDWPGDGEWVSVRPPAGQELWVYAELVTDGVVNSSRVKVRGGPSVNYKDVATLSKGDTVKVLGRTGEWLRIETPPDAVLWISRQYVAPADGSVAPAQAVAKPEAVAVQVEPEPAAVAPPPPPTSFENLPPSAEPERLAVATLPAEPVAIVRDETPVAQSPRGEVPTAEPAKPVAPVATVQPVSLASEHPAVITQWRHDSPVRTAPAASDDSRAAQRESRVASGFDHVSPSQASSPVAAPVASTVPQGRPAAGSASPAVSSGVSSPVAPAAEPVATATTRIRTVSPRAYPRRQAQAPQSRQVEVVPAPGSQRVSYTGEVTAGGRLTLTNRGEYRLVTRDAQGRALTLCFLSGSADQLESLRGESVKVEGFQTWNTGARHPTVAVDSIIRVAPQN